MTLNLSSEIERSTLSRDTLLELPALTLRENVSRELFELFKELLPRLSPEVRIERLELFVQSGISSDDELAEIAAVLTPRERATLGEFIGRCTEADLFVKTFHDCWSDLSRTNQKTFTDKFLREIPCHPLMVAPFVDLSQAVPDEALTEKRRIPPSYFEKYFDNVQSASQLLELIIRNPEGSDGLATVSYYAQKRTLFLLPFLPRLLENGCIDQKWIDFAFHPDPTQRLCKAQPYGDFMSGAWPSFYEAPEEVAEDRRLREQLARITQERSVEHVSWMRPDHEETPLPIARHLMRLYDLSTERALDHLLRNYEEYSRLLPSEFREGLLGRFAEAGLPVLFATQRIRLSAESALSFIQKVMAEHDSVPIRYDCADLRELIAAGQEKNALRVLLYHLRESEDARRYIGLMSNLESVLSWFSPANQHKVIKAINNHVPQAWLLRPDYLRQHHPELFEKVVSAVAGESRTLGQHYHTIRLYIDECERAGVQTKPDRATFRQLVKDVFSKDAMRLTECQTIRELFTESEYYEMIRNYIRGGMWRIYETSNILKYAAQDKNLGIDRTTVRSILMTRPDMISEMFEHEDHACWNELFSIKERVALLMRHSDGLNLRKVCEDEDFVCAVAADPSIAGAFFSFMEKNTGCSELAELHNSLKLIRTSTEGVRWREHLLSELVSRCRKDPFSAFNEEVYKIIRPEAAEIIEKNVQNFVLYHPHALVDRIPRLVDEGLLSAERFRNIIEENRRSAAFLTNSYDSTITGYWPDKKAGEAPAWLTELNPLLRVAARKSIPLDYYRSVLDELRESPFFPIYSAQLKRVADEELSLRGPQRNPETVAVNEKFRRLVQKVSFLDNCPFACTHSEEIKHMPAKQQQELLGLLELAAIYNIDGNFPADFAGDDINVALRPIRKVMYAHLSTLFGFELAEDAAEQDIEMQTVIDLTRLRSLCVEHSPQAIKFFQELATRYFSGDYIGWRAWGETPPADEPHALQALQKLKDARSLPSELSLEQYYAWLEDTEHSVEESLRVNVADVRKGIRKILDECIVDRHITAEELLLNPHKLRAEYDTLIAPLNQYTNTLKVLRNNAEHSASERYKDTKRKIAEYRAAHDDAIKLCTARLLLLSLQHVTEDNLRKEEIICLNKRYEWKEAFQIMNAAFSAQRLFAHDLGRMNSLLTNAHQLLTQDGQKNHGNLTVTDRFDFGVHLRIGSVPVSTCQSLFHSGDYNMGLLSYLADPSVRILKLYDEKGILVARSVLRLLSDKDGCPALFLERVYMNNFHRSIQDAIVATALGKAEKLGVTLYSHECEGNIEQDLGGTAQDLFSFGGRSPYQYTDAGGGLVRLGRFTIYRAAPILQH